ncbi:MAG: HNH endonuclease [Microthrixaceae bacterium]|nr:HNH endonuclease [Microthrixaceae bacterium]
MRAQRVVGLVLMAAGMAPAAAIALSRTDAAPEIPFPVRAVATVLLLFIAPMSARAWAVTSTMPSPVGSVRVMYVLTVFCAAAASVFSYGVVYQGAPLEAKMVAAAMSVWVFVGTLRFAFEAADREAEVRRQMSTSVALFITAFALIVFSVVIDPSGVYAAAPTQYVWGLWVMLLVAVTVPPTLVAAFTTNRGARTRWWMYIPVFLVTVYISLCIGGTGWLTLHPLIAMAVPVPWMATAMTSFVCATVFLTQVSFSVTLLRRFAVVEHDETDQTEDLDVVIHAAPETAVAVVTAPPPVSVPLPIPSRSALADRRRRDRQRAATIFGQAPSGKLLADLRSGVCVYCGDAASHADHIRPLSRGGWHHELNLVSACDVCNTNSKNSKLLVEWAQTNPELVLHGMLTSPLVHAAFAAETHSLTSLHFRYPGSTDFVRAMCEKYGHTDRIMSARISEVAIDREPHKPSGIPLPPIDSANTHPEVDAPEPRQWAAIGRRKANGNTSQTKFPDLHTAWQQWEPSAPELPAPKELELCSA